MLCEKRTTVKKKKITITGKVVFLGDPTEAKNSFNGKTMRTRFAIALLEQKKKRFNVCAGEGNAEKEIRKEAGESCREKNEFDERPQQLPRSPHRSLTCAGAQLQESQRTVYLKKKGHFSLIAAIV